jgi:hypothetical protein
MTMMRSQVPRRALVAALITAAFGCGGESATTAPVDNFLPVISNFWRNTKVAAHTLTLQSVDDRKPTGSFTGTEAHPTFGSSQASGTWTNSTFSITVLRSGGSVTYSGKFLSRDTLRLIRLADTLVFWHT